MVHLGIYTLVCGKALMLPLLLYFKYQIWVRFCTSLLNIARGSKCEINARDPASLSHMGWETGRTQPLVKSP